MSPRVAAQTMDLVVLSIGRSLTGRMNVACAKSVRDEKKSSGLEDRREKDASCISSTDLFFSRRRFPTEGRSVSMRRPRGGCQRNKEMRSDDPFSNRYRRTIARKDRRRTAEEKIASVIKGYNGAKTKCKIGNYLVADARYFEIRKGTLLSPKSAPSSSSSSAEHPRPGASGPQGCLWVTG